MLVSFLIILTAHWIADFVLQTHWQASNKSKNWEALGRHVVNYSLVMYLVCFFLVSPTQATAFWLITFVTHFITDAITSRISSRLYAKQDWHNFFVIIGLDQLIHQLTLAGTLLFVITMFA